MASSSSSSHSINLPFHKTDQSFCLPNIDFDSANEEPTTAAEGSFQKNEIPYSFWAFFPDGVLTGPKGFSLSSYGTGVGTVEPFLIDEKKITSKHVVFWVEKHLAAQGILPVWEE